jgi:hypothetical protein
MILDRRVVPFKSYHYDWLLAHESIEHGVYKPPSAEIIALETQNSWTGVVNGDVIVCAGTIQQWVGRHISWAYIARRPGVWRHMPWVTEETLKVLAKVPGRIEMTVRTDFHAGQRWALRLGFHVETPLMSKYGPENEDHIGYVRIN